MTQTTEHTADRRATAPAIDVRGVHVRFGGIQALTDVSLHVEPGEVCGLIGPNGAGKTTLFDAVSGVRIPEEGTILLDGQDVTRVGAVARSRMGLRRTFQRVQTFGWLTVEDNLLAALEWRGGGGGMVGDAFALAGRRRRERERRARVDHAIDRCGLTAVRHESAGALPIGIARMVELARAIVADPKVLMLDEPTSGLGDRERDRLGETLHDGTLDPACAVVLVEHDINFVMQHCDRINVLNLGEILAIGTPAEIRNDPLVQSAYLGVASEAGR